MLSRAPPNAASPSPSSRPSRRQGSRSAAPISRRTSPRWRCSSLHPVPTTSPGRPTMSMAAWCRADRQRANENDSSPPRKRGSRGSDRALPSWIPAFAGMTMRSLSAIPSLQRRLNSRLPFYYGWVILGCLCCAGFARQGPAVATLSIFVEPLSREFGWSRAALSGAVSLGGVLAALASPLIGPLVDRYGSRAALSLAVLVTGAAMLLLSLTQSLAVFYLLFCIARMNWAGPFDLAIYGAVNNWFVTRRAFATSIVTVAQAAGLVAMPLIAQLAMQRSGWRFGWLAIGLLTLLVGLLPVWLFMVRRPEDLGLVPDRRSGAGAELRPEREEPNFSRRAALATAGFWLLLLYTVLVY